MHELFREKVTAISLTLPLDEISALMLEGRIFSIAAAVSYHGARANTTFYRRHGVAYYYLASF